MPGGFEAVIGLEVHAQVLSTTKLFCACSTVVGAPPNTHVCPVCLGLPGALPVPNRRVVDRAVCAGAALGCTVRRSSRFARKNYFYPDLAKGYQISQFDLPLCEHGGVEVETSVGPKRVRIRRIHIEEDAAKNLHGGAEGETLVDFNRAGVPLMEIVSEPDLRSAEEVEAYLRGLREVLMFLGVSDGNLEEGSFRCDVNVSLRPRGADALGTRTELKNINSFRFIRRAVDYEVGRQEAILASGGTIEQETRAFSERRGETLPMRGKEEAHDYRYFPDPDLPPLEVAEARIEALRAALPELPAEKRARYQAELGLTEYDARVLTGHPAIAAYFEAVARDLSNRTGGDAEAKAGKRAANFVQAEVLRHVTTDGLRAHFPTTASMLGELLALGEDGTVSGKMAKEVFFEMVKTGRSAARIIDELGLVQMTDVDAIEAEVRRVLAAHPDAVEKYRAGKTKLMGFFMGQVMQQTRGAANPKQVNETLKRLLAR